MRTMQRAAAVVGLTLITGGVFGVTASAAMAAPTDNAAQSADSNRRDGDRDGDRDRDWDRDRDRDRDRDWGRDRHRRGSYIAGWFGSERACEWYGWVGDRRDRWENPRCYQVSRKVWVLRVQPDHDRRGRH